MKKIKTYERIQDQIHFVAGIIEKLGNGGLKYYNVFVRWKDGANKIERTDFRTIYDRQKAIENSQTMLEQCSFEYSKRGLK